MSYARVVIKHLENENTKYIYIYVWQFIKNELKKLKMFFTFEKHDKLFAEKLILSKKRRIN